VRAVPREALCRAADPGHACPGHAGHARPYGHQTPYSDMLSNSRAEAAGTRTPCSASCGARLRGRPGSGEESVAEGELGLDQCGAMRAQSQRSWSMDSGSAVPRRVVCCVFCVSGVFCVRCVFCIPATLRTGSGVRKALLSGSSVLFGYARGAGSVKLPSDSVLRQEQIPPCVSQSPAPSRMTT
jgi:hypothetical protein